MMRRTRIRYTDSQKAWMWDRWQQGESLHQDEGSRFFLNVQPVIPVSIGEDWNMISRTIIPVISQDDIFPGAGTQFGLGDTVQSLFFSPKASGSLCLLGMASSRR